jgi:asparagine synthase (glutamine-hydrolysing)
MIESIEEDCFKLRFLLEKAVQKNLIDGILFSGGLDTSILATVASKFTCLKAFTCAFQGAPAPDVRHAQLLGAKLKLRHYIHYFNEDELFEAIPLVVKTLRLFDPMEVRNSLTILIA